MNRLQLATLLSWADNGAFEGRKRLQKVVFFLQEAGCPLDCRFTLHHYGPYCRDVADRCDEMVAGGLIDETGGPPTGEMQYVYTLKPGTRELLEKSPDPQMQEFKAIGTELIDANLWSLELGSTILFFRHQTGDWNEALAKACEFKKTDADAKPTQVALALAKQFYKQGQN